MSDKQPGRSEPPLSVIPEPPAGRNPESPRSEQPSPPYTSARSCLKEGTQKCSLDLSTRQTEQLESYAASVLECNKTYNLMRSASHDDFIIHHILDSLAAAPYLKGLFSRFYPGSCGVRSLTVGDIGSGGGCPGIPLAVVFPGQSFVLVERMERRASFLENTIRTLGLSNARVLCSRAEDVKSESFDVEVLRAFHPFDEKTAKVLLRMLKRGGSIVAYKARKERIASEMRSVSHLIPRWRLIELKVPFMEDYERNLVVIKKD